MKVKIKDKEYNIPVLLIGVVITIAAVAVVAYKIEKTWKNAKVTSDNQTLRIVSDSNGQPQVIFDYHSPPEIGQYTATPGNAFLPGTFESYSPSNLYRIPTGDTSKGGGTGADKVFFYDSSRVPDFLLGQQQITQLSKTRENEALYGNLGDPLLEGQFRSLFNSYPV